MTVPTSVDVARRTRTIVVVPDSSQTINELRQDVHKKFMAMSLNGDPQLINGRMLRTIIYDAMPQSIRNEMSGRWNTNVLDVDDAAFLDMLMACGESEDMNIQKLESDSRKEDKASEHLTTNKATVPNSSTGTMTLNNRSYTVLGTEKMKITIGNCRLPISYDQLMLVAVNNKPRLRCRDKAVQAKQKMSTKCSQTSVKMVNRDTQTRNTLNCAVEGDYISLFVDNLINCHVEPWHLHSFASVFVLLIHSFSASIGSRDYTSRRTGKGSRTENRELREKCRDDSDYTEEIAVVTSIW
ncbi:hypothetical protein FPQ18DRAFT_377968 [Pyronema domesticum]|nr:hypothetical protein FPQ18DRAFT_377968 [Pyronema domesticum]